MTTIWKSSNIGRKCFPFSLSLSLPSLDAAVHRYIPVCWSVRKAFANSGRIVSWVSDLFFSLPPPPSPLRSFPSAHVFFFLFILWLEFIFPFFSFLFLFMFQDLLSSSFFFLFLWIAMAFHFNRTYFFSFFSFLCYWKFLHGNLFH